MLGQPVSMLIPRVVGFKLTGAIPAGATATDVVLTITEMLRKHGVVGKFVEFYGEGVAAGAAGQPRHDRQHEPRVRLDLRDLPDRRRHARLPAPHRPQRRAGRPRRGVRQGAGPVARRRPDEPRALRVPRARPVDRRAVDRRPEAPAGPHRADRRQGARSARRCATTSTTTHDGDVDEAATSPSRPATRPARRHDGAARSDAPHRRPARRHDGRPNAGRRSRMADGTRVRARPRRRRRSPRSPRCTNTSNPSVMIGGRPAGQERRRARASRSSRGSRPRWRPAPRSSPTTTRRPACALPREARLPPGRLRLHDLHRQLRPAASRRSRRRSTSNDLAVVSVLSGNRNFEGRINPDVKMNYLASPAAGHRLRAGRHDGLRLRDRPARPGHGRQRRLPARTSGRRRPRCDARRRRRRSARRCSPRTTPTSSPATSAGGRCRPPTGDTFDWDAESTYVRKPPYFDGMTMEPTPVDRHRRRPRAGQARRLGHDRPHQPGRRRSRPTARPARTSPSTASSARTSTPTARAAATTR